MGKGEELPVQSSSVPVGIVSTWKRWCHLPYAPSFPGRPSNTAKYVYNSYVILLTTICMLCPLRIVMSYIQLYFFIISLETYGECNWLVGNLLEKRRHCSKTDCVINKVVEYWVDWWIWRSSVKINIHNYNLLLAYLP